MSNQITLNGTVYISAGAASKSFDMTRDYIARLCRENRVAGQQIGKSWFVMEQSLKEFLMSQKYARSLRNESLSRARLNEYHSLKAAPYTVIAHDSLPGKTIKERLEDSFAAPKNASAVTGLMNAPSGITHAALQTVHVPIYQVTPVLDVIHKLIAIMCACFVFFIGFAILNPAGLHTSTEIAYQSVVNLQTAAGTFSAPLPRNAMALSATANVPVQRLRAANTSAQEIVMRVLSSAKSSIESDMQNPAEILGSLLPGNTATVSIQITSSAVPIGSPVIETGAGTP